LKDILHLSDTEIAENLNEIRLEHALAAELQLTSQIITKTGIFDPTDRLYGDPQAKYDYSQGEEGGEGGPGGPGGPGGMPGGDLGGGMDGIDALGGPDESGDVGGEEEQMGMESAPAADSGEQISEVKNAKKKLITELYLGKVSGGESYFDQYMKEVLKEKREESDSMERVKTISENFIVNEELNSVVKELDSIIKDGFEDGMGEVLTD
jgi:hypothetical protein